MKDKTTATVFDGERVVARREGGTDEVLAFAEYRAAEYGNDTYVYDKFGAVWVTAMWYKAETATYEVAWEAA